MRPWITTGIHNVYIKIKNKHFKIYINLKDFALKVKYIQNIGITEICSLQLLKKVN